MSLAAISLVVFAITLALTKSKILGGKREFVANRYAIADFSGWIHRWWYSMWTCAMCSGFWIAIPVCWGFPCYNIFVDVLVAFSVNWCLHCLESVLFNAGELLESMILGSSE